MGLLRARPFPRKQPVSLQTGRDRARPLQDTFPNIKSADRTLPAAGRDDSSKQCAGIYRRSLAATAAVNAALTTIIRVDINQTYHNFPKTLAISIWISYNTIDNLTDGSLCYRLRGRYNLRPIT